MASSPADRAGPSPLADRPAGDASAGQQVSQDQRHPPRFDLQLGRQWQRRHQAGVGLDDHRPIPPDHEIDAENPAVPGRRQLVSQRRGGRGGGGLVSFQARVAEDVATRSQRHRRQPLHPGELAAHLDKVDAARALARRRRHGGGRRRHALDQLRDPKRVAGLRLPDALEGAFVIDDPGPLAGVAPRRLRHQPRPQPVRQRPIGHGGVRGQITCQRGTGRPARAATSTKATLFSKRRAAASASSGVTSHPAAATTVAASRSDGLVAITASGPRRRHHSTAAGWLKMSTADALAGVLRRHVLRQAEHLRAPVAEHLDGRAALGAEEHRLWQQQLKAGRPPQLVRDHRRAGPRKGAAGGFQRRRLGLAERHHAGISAGRRRGREPRRTRPRDAPGSRSPPPPVPRYPRRRAPPGP